MIFRGEPGATTLDLMVDDLDDIHGVSFETLVGPFGLEPERADSALQESGAQITHHAEGCRAPTRAPEPAIWAG